MTTLVQKSENSSGGYRSYAEILQDNLARIRQFRLIDDTFFAVCFENRPDLMEFVLRIILDKDDLHVTEMKTQYSIRNLSGHSVQLDSFATDSSGKKYNIEVQRADAGANPKRARYHSSLLDGHLSLQKGEKYRDLPENYVVFLTENDIFGDGLTIYHIERVLVENGRRFQDGSHIIYVNAAQDSDSALGRLMKDFMCADPNQMNYSVMADVTRYFKENEQGVKHMCQIMETAINDSYHAGIVKGREKGREEGREQGREEGREEGREQGREEERTIAEIKRKAEHKALALLKEGLSVEKIAEITELPVENVQELADIIL